MSKARRRIVVLPAYLNPNLYTSRGVLARVFALALAFVASMAFACSASAKPLQVLLLGDSITDGDAEMPAYRLNLWQRLVERGLDIDLVGSQTDSGMPPGTDLTFEGKTFDQDHEGHAGWRIDHVIHGNQDGEGKLTDWLQGYTPDIAVVMLGTNDALQRQPGAWAEREMRRVIETLRRDNDQMAILLCTPPPSTRENNEYLAETVEAYEKLAVSLNTRQSPIVLVDTVRGFDMEQGLLPDGIHLTPWGCDFVADRIAAGVFALDEAHLSPARPTSARVWGSVVVIPVGAAIGFILLGRAQLRREREGGHFNYSQQGAGLSNNKAGGTGPSAPQTDSPARRVPAMSESSN